MSTDINVGIFYGVSHAQKLGFPTLQSAAGIVRYGEGREGMVVKNEDGSITVSSEVDDNKPAGEIHTYVRRENLWRERQSPETFIALTNGREIKASVNDAGQLTIQFEEKEPGFLDVVKGSGSFVDWVNRVMPTVNAKVTAYPNDELSVCTVEENTETTTDISSTYDWQSQNKENFISTTVTHLVNKNPSLIDKGKALLFGDDTEHVISFADLKPNPDRGNWFDHIKNWGRNLAIEFFAD